MTSKPGSHPERSWADQRLLTLFRRGEPLRVLRAGPLGASGGGPGGRPAGPDGSRTATSQVVHASVIRDLLLRDPVPGQVLSVTGADIEGELDLEFVKSECPLRLENCTFHHAVKLSEARLRSVSLRGSSAPGIDAGHLTVTGDLTLDRVRLTGPLHLGGAHLEDDLHLADAVIDVCQAPGGAAGSRAALDLSNINVKGKVDADGLKVHGTVLMGDATVAGSLQMRDAVIRAVPPAESPSDIEAWSGDGLAVGGELKASGLRATGSVTLIDARVLSLVLRDTWIWNKEGTALFLDRLQAGGSVYCDGQVHGGVQAAGIHVGATLYLGPGAIRAAARRAPGAVDLRWASIGGDVNCRSLTSVGGFSLAGGRIGGQVVLRDVTLAHGTGNAIAFSANRATIGSSLSCTGAFTCNGTMSLVDARVGGEFTVVADGFQPDARCALAAPGITVTRDVTVKTTGTVDLSGADVSGDLTFYAGRLHGNADRPAADLSGLKAGVLTLYGLPSYGCLDLTRASVTLLRDGPEHLRRWTTGHLVLDGLEYGDIVSSAHASAGEPDRLPWLASGTQWARGAAGTYERVRFIPQPYQQLAGTYRRAGKDREARRVLHAMHRRNTAVISFRDQAPVKLWNKIQNLFLGYGYVPSRALAWLLGLAAVTALWFAYMDKAHIGIMRAAIMSLGLVLPGAGYERIEPPTVVSPWSHVIAALLILCGLLLGATVLAALARVIKR